MSRRDVPDRMWLRAAAARCYLEESQLLSWIFNSDDQQSLKTVLASRDLNFGPRCKHCERCCVIQFVYEMHIRVCHSDRCDLPANGKLKVVPRPVSAATDFEVAEIRGRKVKDGKVEYLLRWKNYASCAWVAAEDVNCPRLLRQFLDPGKSKKKKKINTKKGKQMKKTEETSRRKL